MIQVVRLFGFVEVFEDVVILVVELVFLGGIVDNDNGVVVCFVLFVDGFVFILIEGC